MFKEIRSKSQCKPFLFKSIIKSNRIENGMEIVVGFLLTIDLDRVYREYSFSM